MMLTMGMVGGQDDGDDVLNKHEDVDDQEDTESDEDADIHR